MKEKEDIVQRVNIDRIANEDGEWAGDIKNSEALLQTAIFEAVFSYIRMAAEDARLDGSFEISPEKIINAMMKRTEIEIVDALIKSYNKRTFDDDEE